MEDVRKIVPEDEERKVDLLAYWKIFWRKKYYLIVPVVLSLLIAVIGVRFLTPIYESSTLFSMEDEYILSSTMEQYVRRSDERDRMRDRKLLAKIEATLKSRNFLELIINELGINKSPFVRNILQKSSDDMEIGISGEERVMRYLISLLRNRVKVYTPMTGFFRISFEDYDPTTAYIVAGRISDKYIDVTRQAQLQGIRQAGAFSDEQLAIYKEKLETSEKELAQVKRELLESDVESNPVSSGNLYFAEALLGSISAERGRNEVSLNRVKERLIEVFRLVPSSEQIPADEAVRSLERQMIAVGEERLLLEIDPESEETAVEGSVDEVAVIWDELRQRIGEVVRNEYHEISSELHPLITEYYFQRYKLEYFRNREQKLKRYINRHRSNLERRPHLEREYNRLNLEVETNRAIYQAFLESKTSAQISEAAQSTNLGMRVSIVERAEKPLSPVKPDKVQLILVALMFGGICGLGIILLTEYLNDSFRTIAEVQKITKLPVLGTVPKTVSHFSWERKKRSKAIFYWIVGVLVYITLLSGVFYVYSLGFKGSEIEIHMGSE